MSGCGTDWAWNARRRVNGEFSGPWNMLKELGISGHWNDEVEVPPVDSLALAARAFAAAWAKSASAFAIFALCAASAAAA